MKSSGGTLEGNRQKRQWIEIKKLFSDPDYAIWLPREAPPSCATRVQREADVRQKISDTMKQISCTPVPTSADLKSLVDIEPVPLEFENEPQKKPRLHLEQTLSGVAVKERKDDGSDKAEEKLAEELAELLHSETIDDAVVAKCVNLISTSRRPESCLQASLVHSLLKDEDIARLIEGFLQDDSARMYKAILSHVLVPFFCQLKSPVSRIMFGLAKDVIKKNPQVATSTFLSAVISNPLSAPSCEFLSRVAKERFLEPRNVHELLRAWLRITTTSEKEPQRTCTTPEGHVWALISLLLSKDEYLSEAGEGPGSDTIDLLIDSLHRFRDAAAPQPKFGSLVLAVLKKAGPRLVSDEPRRCKMEQVINTLRSGIQKPAQRLFAKLCMS
eukprot:Rmarinus@m.7392